MTDQDETPQGTAADLLIVDDDPSGRRLLKRALERLGFKVREASDGQEAVRQFSEHRPGLVLLDVFMPVMNGFEACAAMRQLDPDAVTPILMLTAADDVETIDHAFEAGATDFILKPFNWKLLSQQLRYALRNSARDSALRQRHRRQQSLCRLAKLLFWEWTLSDDRLHWDEDMGFLADPGTKPPNLDSMSDFLNRVQPQDRTRVSRLLEMVRDQGGRVDTELHLEFGEQSRLVHLAAERGTQPTDQDQVFGVLNDLTDRGLKPTECIQV